MFFGAGKQRGNFHGYHMRLCIQFDSSLVSPPPPPLFALRSLPEDASQPRDTQCVWFFGIVGHEACPILLRTRVHTFFLSDPRKAASLMPCGDHNTYWAVAITGEGEDIEVS